MLTACPSAGATTEYLIDPAGEATNIYNGQVVIIGTDGYIAISTASGADATTNNLGGNGIGAIGVFVGCEYEMTKVGLYLKLLSSKQNKRESVCCG